MAATKALEVEMTKRFLFQFVEHLESLYPSKSFISAWPTSLLNQYGKKKRAKDFTLGSVAYVLCYCYAQGETAEQKENNKAKLLEFAQNKLFSKSYDVHSIQRCLSLYAAKIEEVRNDYRNPSAHTNELKKINAENCFALVTDVEKILKTMLDSFMI